MFKNLFNSKKEESQSIAWNQLRSIEELEKIKKFSNQKKVLIFKHSTRCGVSMSALDKLQTTWEQENAQNVETVFLDLIAHRDVSNAIASTFGITHQSPQILVIENEKCIFTTSHWQISFDAIRQAIS